MRFNKYRIAAVLANIDNNDRAASRSSLGFPFTWGKQEVLESGLLADISNHFIKLLACLVTLEMLRMTDGSSSC